MLNPGSQNDQAYAVIGLVSLHDETVLKNSYMLQKLTRERIQELLGLMDDLKAAQRRRRNVTCWRVNDFDAFASGTACQVFDRDFARREGPIGSFYDRIIFERARILVGSINDRDRKRWGVGDLFVYPYHVRWDFEQNGSRWRAVLPEVILRGAWCLVCEASELRRMYIDHTLNSILRGWKSN